MARFPPGVKGANDAVVLVIKECMGGSDPSWDRVWWGRAAKVARVLLQEFRGSVPKAERCVRELSARYSRKTPWWPPEWILRDAADWNRGNTESETRAQSHRGFRVLGEIMRAALEETDQKWTR